ncbi:MAG: hypothetical protein NVS3B29_01280 [Candidatus Saccharimonadales bacterium]
MTILIDLLIVAAIIYAGFSGWKRGFVLLALEIVGFVLATVAAFALYQLLGPSLGKLLHVSDALGNISAFIVVWMVVEIICGLIVRFGVLPRINRSIHLSRPNQIGGSLAGVVKSAALFALALLVFNALPVPKNIKTPVITAAVPKLLLAASGPLQQRFNSSLARDLLGSFDFFTVPAEPESDTRINLGYTTTNVRIDPGSESAMLEMLNHERTSRGLKALTLNPKAKDVARSYSAEMFARGYFSHLTPEGKTPFDRMKAGGVTYASAGENLALAPTLQQAEDGLMKSPGHRANILSPEYRTVGIGIVVSPTYGMMVTQDFTD